MKLANGGNNPEPGLWCGLGPLSELGNSQRQVGGVVDIRCNPGGGLAGALAAVPSGHGWHGGQNLAGRLPENQVLAALDAIGIGSFVGWFIGIAMAALGVGGSAIIASPWAPGRADEAGVALRRSGIRLGLGDARWVHPLAGADPISRLMGVAGCGFFLRQYIGIVALSMPAAGLFMVLR